ncbi:MFS transporter [Streptomyces sp. 21So2-11]|uniref:MFS transporter n=1 Tax=Streptomyces sp. 21So2-11 TaxID=3144408 RepID=UPI003219EADA
MTTIPPASPAPPQSGTIAYAVLLITGARLGDLLGHRRAYLGGLALFTAASLACGLAADSGQLIAFRFVQGAGAALMIPQVLSLIQRNFRGERRVRALGAYSAVLATGAAAGQVAGGVLARRGGAPLIAPRVLRLPGMGRAVLRITLVMVVNAGFLFVLTLHVQGGLGYSALQAGLTFAPTAVVFGVVGLTWRRWPAAVQRGLIPAGFVLSALSCVAVGLALRDGGTGGLGLYVAFIGVGAGLALGFSPTLTGALAAVRPQDAADAGGVLVTSTQLGQLIGVATFGTLYLNGLDAPGAYAYADALWTCAIALAVASILGALACLLGSRHCPSCEPMAESDRRRGTTA